MAWNKAYTRIVWQNSPITDTPLNATNLNKMDAALNEIDNRVLLLEGSAFVHIKYSDYPNPSNIQMKDTPAAYMGICVTSEETAPTQASAYTWNRVRGEEVQLQVADEHIQWKYAADATWTNLIPLDSLKGDKGDKGDQGLPGVYYGEEEPDPALYQVWVNPSEDGKITGVDIPLPIEASEYQALVASGAFVEGKIYYEVPDGTLE